MEEWTPRSGSFDSGVGGLTVARCRARPAPRRGRSLASVSATLPERPVRAAPDRRGPCARAGGDGLPGRALTALKGTAGHRLQLGQRRLPARCPRALPSIPVGRGGSSRRRYVGPSLPPDQRPDLRGVIGTAATVTSRAYDDAFCRRAARRADEALACPRFVECVERGETNSSELLRGRRRTTSAPIADGRRRHARARLHPLPTVDRRDLVCRPGGWCPPWSRALRRRRRTSTVSWPAPPDSVTSPYRRRDTGSWRPAIPNPSLGSARGSSGPRSARSRPRSMQRVTRRAGRSDQWNSPSSVLPAPFRRRRNRVFVVPRRARRLPAAARHRQRVDRRVAGGMRSARTRRGRDQSSAR